MWLHEKLHRVQDTKPRIAGVPENITLTVTAIYELLRIQRNDFGHRPTRHRA